MQTSSPRPYFAIFAIVAIAVAAFILKQEFAGAAQAKDVVSTSPRRQLVKDKKGVDMIPEPIPDWFKRVGYKDLGFVSEDQMNQTEKMLTTGGRHKQFTPEDYKLIHQLLTQQGPVKDIGISCLPGLEGTEVRKQFIPDVKALYEKGSPNQAFRQVLTSWCNSGDEDLIKGLEKDPNKDIAAEATKIVTNFEFPGKDM